MRRFVVELPDEVSVDPEQIISGLEQQGLLERSHEGRVSVYEAKDDDAASVESRLLERVSMARDVYRYLIVNKAGRDSVLRAEGRLYEVLACFKHVLDKEAPKP